MFKEGDKIIYKKDNKEYKIKHMDDERVIQKFTHLQDQENKLRTLIIRSRDLEFDCIKL